MACYIIDAFYVDEGELKPEWIFPTFFSSRTEANNQAEMIRAWGHFSLVQELDMRNVLWMDKADIF